ncbi:MAG: DUF1549 domain-containing protein [Gemmataceae bacterium]
MPAWLAALAALTLDAAAPAPLYSRIDALVEAEPDFRAHDAGPADDAEFCRRVFLDLTGRLPPVDRTRAFLADRAAGKRPALIDALLASDEHARHLATHFDVTLMERRPDVQVPHAAWAEFLFTAFKANRPWDETAREVLSGDDDPARRHRAKFFLERAAEPHLVTRDISRLFLGTNLQCAQCHDHPLVEDYKQDDYYGLFAFVGRTSLLADGRKKRGTLSEKADGEASFQSVFDPKKVTKTSLPRVPGGVALMDPKADPKSLYVTAPAAAVAGVPRYSRRQKLAGQVARADYGPFRRNLANRLWALLMGRGLVEPLDMDHSGNPPTHPEVLDAIADELLARRMDVRHVLRQIANTRAYQRSSVPKSDAKDAPLYAAAPLKPLTPEQLALSVLEATGYAETQRRSLGARPAEAALHARLSPLVPTFVKVYGGEAGSAAGFDARIDQALFLANGPAVRSWLVDRPGSLLARLKGLKGDALADELYLSVLGRLPDAQERREVAAALARRPGSLAEVAWGLIASTEFRFNH